MAPTDYLYQKKIVEKGFRALYNNRTFKIIKKTMQK